MKYRPWGPVDWALSLGSRRSWQFVGAVGTEERSLSSWSHLRKRNLIGGELFAEIHDDDSVKYGDRTLSALEMRRRELMDRGGDLMSVRTFHIMAELYLLMAFSDAAEGLGQSLIFDITSFPKRFFFPILRTLVNSNRVRDLVLTYTSPGSYAVDGPLYEETDAWRCLPGFGETTGEEVWVVSVGFLVESLRKYVGDHPREKIDLLIPFPAPLSILRRTWESVATLEQGHSAVRFEKHRVETIDVSSAFDRIRSLAGTPARGLSFAPFGPKPMSAAMCLYAIQKGSSVHYPQPRVYHPEYSKGILNDDPETAINAYWVKHNGECLYLA